MAGGEMFVPCPHCRSVLRYRVGTSGELLSGNCLLCGQPFPEHLLEAIGSLAAERSATRVLDEEAPGGLPIAEIPVGQLVG